MLKLKGVISKGRTEVEEKRLVSIIVPIFNVEDCLDRCIESLVGQSYGCIEIILILGKSTDRSNEIAYEWSKKDRRIMCFLEKRKGLSAARNQGIQLSKGEYVIFVDSDDWVEREFVERLYVAISENDADFAECDYYRVRNYSNIKEPVRCNSMMNRVFNLEERIILGGVTAWKYITKREFWITNEIRYPECSAEDVATYLPILLLSRRITKVDGYLYNYRKERIGNLCSDKTNHTDVYPSINYLVRTLKQHDLFDSNKSIISAYTRRWLSRTLSSCVGKINDDEINNVRRDHQNIYRDCIGDEVLTEWCMGGFNLSRIVNKLPFIEDPFGRINFTSIISLCSPKPLELSISHNNAYRNQMLNREKSRSFSKLIKESAPDYFFFDLLEERHNILEFDDGYMTKSDAYDQAEIDNATPNRIIERDSDECMDMWKKSCNQFFEFLLSIVKPCNVFMIKNYLCTSYGDGNDKYRFEDIDRIEKNNLLLKEYYEYIETNFQQIKVVDTGSIKDYITDTNYEFGCWPWHLNEWANIDIARMIAERDENGILYSVL